MNWIDEARADYIDRAAHGYAMPRLPSDDRPLSPPWTPERVIEVQGEQLAHVRRRLRGAEKMIAALVKVAAERGYRVEVLRVLMDGVEDKDSGGDL